MSTVKNSSKALYNNELHGYDERPARRDPSDRRAE
jgi:hypothetical protein